MDLNDKYLDVIYDKLKPIIDEMYLEYSYLKISLEDYNNLITIAIEEGIKKVVKNGVSNSNFFEKYISNYMKNYVRNLLKDKNNFLNIVSNYIESINELDEVTCIYKLQEFFYDLKVDISLEQYVDLITNIKKLNDWLKIVIDKNIEVNDELNMFIDAYNLVNNIEVVEEFDDNLEEDNDDSLSSDLVKVYIQDIPKELLTKEEEYELFLKVRDGDEEAKKTVAERNLRLVISIAKKYVVQSVPLIDLIQDGNVGLMVAIERFDVTKGYRFSTYATYWIKQSIQRAIWNTGRTVRIPVHMQERLHKVKKVKTKLTQLLEKEPTIEEIADEMGVDINTIYELYDLTMNIFSLNERVGDEEDNELEAFIPSEEQLEEETIENLFSAEMQNIIETRLSGREKEVILLRYGFVDGQAKTLAEIGKMFNLTRERIRQIESGALKKLENTSYFKNLVDSPNEVQVVENTETPEVKEVDKRGRKEKEFFEFFSEYNQEDINRAINALSDKDKEIIRRKIDNRELTQKEKNRFNRTIVAHIKKMITTGVYEDTRRKPQSIYEYFSEFDKEDIDRAVLCLGDDDKEIIRKRNAGMKPTEKEKLKFYTTIASHIKRIITTGNYESIIPNIYEYLSEFDKENVDKAFECLKDTDKEIVRKRCSSTPLTKYEKNRFYMAILPNMKKMLTSGVYKQNKPRPQNIYEYFPMYNKEDIDLAISNLRDTDQEIIRKKNAGIVLDNKSRIRFYRVVVPSIQKFLVEPVTIYEYFSDYNKEDIDKAVNCLKEEDQELIRKKFNRDKLTQQEKSRFKRIIVRNIQKKITTEVNNVETLNNEEDLTYNNQNILLSELFASFNLKEIIIVFLKLGLKYETEEIAKYLNVTEMEVIATTKKVLTKYYEVWINYLNNLNDIKKL